jgi:hypothetical protein
VAAAVCSCCCGDSLLLFVLPVAPDSWFGSILLSLFVVFGDCSVGIPLLTNLTPVMLLVVPDFRFS